LNKKGNYYINAENICLVKYLTILLSLSAPLTDCRFSDATKAARIDGKVVIPNSSQTMESAKSHSLPEHPGVEQDCLV